MNQFDMQGFLEDIQECCDEVSLEWSMYNLDPEKIKVLKRKLNEFALEKKDTILSFYQYAKGQGRYLMVTQVPLFNAMSEYETYHDDLVTFIRAMLKADTKYQNIDDAVRHIKEAITVDEKFQQDLFKDPVKIVFPQALEDMDVIPALYTFIDKVYDTFIYLKQKDELASPRVKALIDLYTISTVRFVKRMISLLILSIEKMVDVQSGNHTDPKVEPYRLI